MTHTGTDCGASKTASHRASSKGPIELSGLELLVLPSGNDDFVLRSLVSSCSNVVLCAGVVERPPRVESHSACLPGWCERLPG